MSSKGQGNSLDDFQLDPDDSDSDGGVDVKYILPSTTYVPPPKAEPIPSHRPRVTIPTTDRDLVDENAIASSSSSESSQPNTPRAKAARPVPIKPSAPVRSQIQDHKPLGPGEIRVRDFAFDKSYGAHVQLAKGAVQNTPIQEIIVKQSTDEKVRPISSGLRRRKLGHIHPHEQSANHPSSPKGPEGEASETPEVVTFAAMPSGAQVPQPGPAKLRKDADLDAWLTAAKANKYLPEKVMKQLCEMCKELLMEESNTQPVSTPVTICGDIHGQFYDLLELLRVAGGMPGEENVERPEMPKNTISSDDIEPPTEITDPKLRKKMKNLSVTDEVGPGESGGTSLVSSVVSSEEDDDDEGERGRSRTVENESTEIREGNQGLTGNGNFIFMGDFVDRGYFSLETLTLLLCLKARYPHRMTLIRGNHESRQITQVYGFYEECQQKYGNASVWKAACQVFDFLPLAALVDGKVLCVHGGLSPEIRTIDQIRVVARAQEIPHEGAFCDLVWSDPEEVETWAVSPRGAGWLFGDKVATEFNHVNNLQLIARAHQLVNEGYKWHFKDKSVVTVWSAPNYCYRCGNVASIMNLGEDLDPKFSIFSAVPDQERAIPVATGRRNDYFL